MSSWWTNQEMPSHDGDGWALWRGRAKPCMTDSDVELSLRNWNPLEAVLVGTPGSKTFVVPPLANKIGEFAIAGLRRRTLYGISSIALFAFLTLILGFIKSDQGFIKISAVCFLFLGLAIYDYIGPLKKISSIADRATFFYWVKYSTGVRTGFNFWLFVCIAMGSTQWWLQRRIGYDATIINYGLVFNLARQGQWWRFLTGPFFHAGLAHYISNSIMLLFVGPIVWAMIGWRSVLLLVAGSSIAALFQMLFSSADFDSFIGISGGVFTLFGVLLGGRMLNARLLPEGMFQLCLAVAVMSGLSAAIISARAGNVAHIAGAAFGVLAVAVFRESVSNIGRGDLDCKPPVK